MRRAFPIFALTAALAFGGAALADPIEPLNAAKVEDHLREPSTMSIDGFFARLNSSKLFVGVHLRGDPADGPAALDYSSFKLGPVPPHDANEPELRVCLSIDSLDTLYSGTAEFRVLAPVGGISEHRLNSDKQTKLKDRFHDDNVVFRALYTVDCASQREGYLVAAGVATEPSHLEVLISLPVGELDLTLDSPGGDPIGIECAPTEDLEGYRCAKPLASIEPGNYLLTARITHPLRKPKEFTHSVWLALTSERLR